MRGVNFDAVETGRLRAPCGGSESCGRLLDARERHLLRDNGLECRLVDRVRDCRRRNRRLAADVYARMPAGMAELDRRLGAAAVDGIDEPRQAGDEAVVIDPDFAAPVPAGFLG